MTFPLVHHFDARGRTERSDYRRVNCNSEVVI